MIAAVKKDLRGNMKDYTKDWIKSKKKIGKYDCYENINNSKDLIIFGKNGFIKSYKGVIKFYIENQNSKLADAIFTDKLAATQIFTVKPGQLDAFVELIGLYGQKRKNNKLTWFDEVPKAKIGPSN